MIDLTVAFLPAFLLWKVQMKRKTKVVLHILFALGIVTAAISIGRAAAINFRNLTTDTTCTLFPTGFINALPTPVNTI